MMCLHLQRGVFILFFFIAVFKVAELNIDMALISDGDFVTNVLIVLEEKVYLAAVSYNCMDELSTPRIFRHLRHTCL